MSTSVTPPASGPTGAVALPTLVPSVAQLPKYVFAWLDDLKATARARGAALIDLGIGSPDLPTPPGIADTVARALAHGADHGYPPFRGTERFRGAVTGFMRDRFGVPLPPEQALCVSGAKEAIAQLSLAYLDEGDLALVPDIHYPVHARAPGMVGGSAHLLPLLEERGFLPALDAIPDEVARRARLLVVNYPHNPTGAVATLEFYEEAVAFCRRHGIVLVSDLAYSELTFDGFVAPSALQVPGAMDVTVEVHSCSKSFSMAGFRVGFAVGSRDVLEALYAVRSNMGYGTPTSIQEGAAFAFEHHAALTRDTVAAYQARRDALAAGFRSLGWPVPTPRGTMFLWLRVPAGFTAQQWTEHLVDATGVVVTPGNAFGPGGEGYFRVSMVAPPPVLADAIDRLRARGIRYR